MKTDDIREKYLNFFESKKHKRVESDSLIPQDDPTLLFSGAGMNQFKDYFLGIKKDMTRATSSQKCLRTGDLDNVGKTPYHHTFFEMLGNFSFGDYFKKDAIHWAWEFLSKELSIPEEKLQVSVHQSDDEAYDIWLNEIKLPKDRISKLGDKSNFWPANAPEDGPNGPCGPCSEIFFDQGENTNCSSKKCDLECDCGRFAEIWNLVFTQFDRKAKGKLEPLAAKNIDTGMGLERLACVLQGKGNNFEIDILAPLVEKVISLLNLKNMESKQISYTRAIVDHIRAAIFSINDGAIPSNEGRGYVIRKLIRRSVWLGKQLRKDQNISQNYFLNGLAEEIIRIMKLGYPDLEVNKKAILMTLNSEEEKFWITIEQGEEILKQELEELKKKKKKQLPSKTVFKLYDTFGFPLELTKSFAEEYDVSINIKEFEGLMDKQRELSKQGSDISGNIFNVSELDKIVADIKETTFVGYDNMECNSKVLFAEQKENQLIVILEKTPFYPEGGGQVGDRGILSNDSFKGDVIDTKAVNKRTIHFVKIISGSLQEKDTLTASVDKIKREATKKNHTATHILQAVLRKTLGDHVRQLGSLVNEDKLRFDFSHQKALTLDEIKNIEVRVNKIILSNIPAQAEVVSISEAKKKGALAFFGDKYGEKVRLLSVGDVSLEFCGGTHVSSTGDIGAFIITTESSVASGTRRIEAVTGLGAIQLLQEQRSQLSQIGSLLKSTSDEAVDRIKKIQSKVKELEKNKSQNKSSSIDLDNLVKNASNWNSVNVITSKFDSLNIAELRHQVDLLKQKSKKSLIIVFSQDGNKANTIVSLTKDLEGSEISANDVIKKVLKPLEGTGGGRKDMAQGGGKNPEKIDDIISNITTVLDS